MTTKHFFPHTEGVVVQGLESLVARNSHLALDVPNKVVYAKSHPPSKVAVISGGGSGHEPAWSGYVGDGMLAAAVNGEVFASPSTKQVMAAIQHVPSEAGIILCITNYTGDNLHFGLAREKAAGLGYKIDMLRMTDDVALGRKQTENTGRRGLAANMFVLKLCGSAAADDYGFDQCMKIGLSVNAHAVTVGSSLDHCHIPGREHHRSIPSDAYVLGMGIHNEPGLHEIAPIPSAEDLVGEMLRYCLDSTDADRAFVRFGPGDVTLLLINNFGGLSNFELEALTNTSRKLLERDWKLTPRRIYAQCFETSLNAPGWSISLLNLSGVAHDTGLSIQTLLHLLDRDTKAPAWPKNGYADVPPTLESAIVHASNLSNPVARPPFPSPTIIDARRLERALRSACDAAIAAEPDITRWDVQMGDGDCGEAVVGMCRAILTKLDAGLCGAPPSTTATATATLPAGGKIPLFHVLDELVEAVEDIGGTLAAILSILLASFATSLRQRHAAVAKTGTKDENEVRIHAASVGHAALDALRNLMNYTNARRGGRTVMDALIPFCETLASTRGDDMRSAVEAAEEGARRTMGMKAKIGRASYIGEAAEVQQDLPPDPGAMAAATFLRGFLEGYSTT